MTAPALSPSIEPAPPTDAQTPAERSRAGKVLLGAIAIQMALFGAFATTVIHQEHYANKVETAIVQPLLNAACQPSSPKASTYKDHGVNTPLAAYVLIKNPGKVRELCSTINASVQLSAQAQKEPSLFNKVAAKNKSAPLNELAASLGVNPSVFSMRATTAYERYTKAEAAAQEAQVSIASPYSSPSL